ncbi:SLC13 family permease [Nesterenkonia alkaliphila]|uniref:Sodium-dependent dicarboxylate transporter SdcS n=1 Tax=Nesterenkonia alkaliphila TaxID=1463631 RepID=A0A7K1UEL9_9MICC|nr:DASS family sodium-coupled anion symporter [Nesterenkonia alkaliphila]MVT24872.1 DASS family sodium-coupled anion symporter [Nesterenkonia alkaliphila]GFZ92655.1 di- and tricarboxylate transporter [Nesterenkonia alkaliphila]
MTPPRSKVEGAHLQQYDPKEQSKREESGLSAGHLAAGFDKPTLMRRLIGLFGGLAAALLVYVVMPGDLEVWLRLTAATAVLMAVWWMTEAIPIPATALLPLIIFPVLVPEGEYGSGDEPAGGVSVDDIGASYGNNIIFIFMGGFMLALAMQRWNLHRRIALLTLRLMGSKPAALIGGFMIATGFLSMWVSNTATAVMMLPIGLSVLMLVRKILAGEDPASAEPETEEEQEEGKKEAIKSNFGTALMLGIAYAASIGSLGTIIGTPPNTFLIGYMGSEHDVHINFGQWMLVGVPISIIMMILTWFLLTKVVFRPEIDNIPGGAELIKGELEKLGRMSQGELRVLLIFVLAACAWVFIPLGTDLLAEFGVLSEDAEPFIDDAGIAMSIAALLFLLPAGGEAKKGVRLLDWESAVKLPWGILLLFGGGLALSGQFGASGLSAWLGEQMEALDGIPVWVLVAVAALGVLILTEMTSNTATATIFVPVAAGVAMGTGVDPLVLAAPVALAATCAFMLPVATPPNAIAYGSGYVTIGQMIKGGLWLNIAGVIVITIASMTLLLWVFGLSL